ncbi:hypothetical protein PtB15_2B261 [Puccinia triticina]|nr:hypothetical protein PtB15_2B261 [Puccinia triticina]
MLISALSQLFDEIVNRGTRSPTCNVEASNPAAGPILYDEAQERSPDTARDEQGSSSSGPGAMSF